MDVPSDAYDYGERASSGAHGVVLTKPHVVELILDLAGYTVDRDLGALRLLEPACGHGAFLTLAVDRLLRSAKIHGRPTADLRSAIRAYDIDADHVTRSRQAVREALRRNSCSGAEAATLARGWVHRDDFLLTHHELEFDAIVGNPPYVRIEQVHPELQRIYRARFKSLSHRADLYVAFVERCLDLLSPAGVLSMICADRWTLNRYGAPLRRILAENFKVRCYLDLHQASPFESEVIAYPGTFAISRGNSERVLVGRLMTASPEECRKVRAALEASHMKDSLPFSVYTSWFRDDEPWVLNSPEHLAVLRDLEARFRSLEECGQTRVGIGVATGSDKIYIVDQTVDVEPDRLVPLVMRTDLRGGRIRDASRFVINPFCNDNGGLVDLRKYPRLASYLLKHAKEIKRRHVAQKNPRNWFRTIDRVYPKLVTTPKLLIPDIAGTNEITYDAGRYHPHHNLYYVTSDSWDLEVLGGLLSSKIALFFIRSYAVRMHSGYLRFQAQYLRRIRVPGPNEISKNLSKSIRAAYRRRDFKRLDELALAAYGIARLPKTDVIDVRRLT